MAVPAQGGGVEAVMCALHDMAPTTVTRAGWMRTAFPNSAAQSAHHLFSWVGDSEPGRGITPLFFDLRHHGDRVGCPCANAQFAPRKRGHCLWYQSGASLHGPQHTGLLAVLVL